MKKILIVLLLIVFIFMSCGRSEVIENKDGIPMQKIASTADISIYKIMIDGYTYIIYDGYYSGNIILAGGQKDK